MRAPSRLAMMALAVLLLPLMVAVSLDYGVTYDELPRQTYGEWLWQLYKGHRTLADFRPETAGPNAHLYGGAFDVAAVAAQKLLPLDPYVVRHGLNAMVGWLGIVCCGVLAARLGGPVAGLLAMLLLTLTPRYWGESMNNPKDLPFATWCTASLAVLATIDARHPVLPLRRALQLSLAIGLALTVRAGALLLLGYAAVVVATQALRAGDLTLRRTIEAVAMLLLVTAVATTLPLPVWPWLLEHPFTGWIDVFMPGTPRDGGRPMLFAGTVVESARLPWTYIPVWLLSTTPPVVVAGMALSGRWLPSSSRYRVATVGLWAAVVFPVVYLIATGAVLYDGVRHVLFIRPAMAALASIGWLALIADSRRLVATGGGVLLVIGLAEPLIFSVRNHPNQTVYFNALVGGPRGADGRFELDSWGNCLFQAEQRVAALARTAGMRVVIPGDRWPMVRLNAARLPELEVDSASRARHHVEVLLVQGTPDEIRQRRSRRDSLFAVTTADGAVLCVVVPGPAFNELSERLNRASHRP